MEELFIVTIKVTALIVQISLEKQEKSWYVVCGMFPVNIPLVSKGKGEKLPFAAN